MRRRSAAHAALAFVLVGASMSAPSLAADGDRPATHVRSTERQVVDALRDGCARSPTFRRLVDELDASDVIVYVQPDSLLPKSLDGRIRFGGATPATRYLRIAVSPRLRGDAFIALVGHELQHAGEVARLREVRDDAAFEALYRAIGDARGAGWDTEAACAIGELVRDELRRTRVAHHDQ
jgi:hypothetical protein